MKEIKQINILSAAKVGAMFSAAMSLVLIVVAGIIQFFLESSFGPNFLIGEITVASILIGTLFYLMFGFVLAGLSAYVYNLSAKLVGGIKFK